jgi:LPXTG-motif cell wall-anchored protein
MKKRIATLAMSGVLVAAMAGFAQERPKAPEAQPVDEPKTVPSAETKPLANVPPAGATVKVQGTQPAPVPPPPAPAATTTTVELPAPPPPAPPPVAVEKTTTEYEALPKTASPYPSIALTGLTLLAAAGLVRRKPAR